MSTEHPLGLAALQMRSGDRVEDNLRQADTLIERAVGEGARVLVLPENFAHMGRHERDKLAIAEADGRGPVQDFLADRAARHGIWLVGGSVFLRSPDDARVTAACLVCGPDGRRHARYDKAHLFDVAVSEAEQYRESATIRPGPGRPVLVEAEGTRIGLSICYDLRFPEMYRALVRRGAEILLVPAAFTHATGRAHWSVLLRARAIENQCAVVAPNQCGEAVSGRRTWGHSQIIDPWGQVLVELEELPGVATARVDLKELRALRRRFPVLQHRLDDSVWTAAEPH